jgi:hypothetical protein
MVVTARHNLGSKPLSTFDEGALLAKLLFSTSSVWERWASGAWVGDRERGLLAVPNAIIEDARSIEETLALSCSAEPKAKTLANIALACPKLCFR